MTSLNSWLSPGVMHALGWTLIHSLWQCMGVAALASALMAFSRRPSFRYLVAVGALVAMLAVPVATLSVLMKSDTPVQTFFPASSSVFVPAATAIADASLIAAPSMATGNNTGSAAGNFSPRVFPSPGGFPARIILPWLVGAWLSGVAFFSLRFVGGFLLLEQRRHRKSIAPNPRILSMCRELQRQLGLDRAVRYLECSWLQAPAVIGWFRPIVLLPISTLSGLSEEQLRAVVAHELAHIRRLDAFVNLFQIVVETLLFYHPATWWLNRRIRAERELCCDEIAVSLTGNRLEYARALTLMAEWKSAPVLAMAANRGPLSGRVFHILERKPFGTRQSVTGVAGGVLFLTAALAAADALFGIAYPIPIAHAKESPRAALSFTQPASTTPVAENPVVRPALHADEPTTKNADTTPDQPKRNEAPGPGTAGAPLDRIDSVKNSLAENLPAFSPAAPPQPLPNEVPAFGFLTASIISTAAADAVTGATNNPPVLPVTPSGEGDPNAMVCRAPQRLPGSDAFGPKACAQNSIWAQLAAKGRDLGPDAKTVFDRPTVEEPTGEGHPDAVTCRKPQALPSAWHLRSYGPEICMSNTRWAKLRTDHKRITEDGLSIVDTWPLAGESGPFGTPGIPSPAAQIVR